VIVTAVLTPMLTAWAYKRAQKREQKRAGIVPIATYVSEEGRVELDKSQGAVNQG
jgi:hypothetical protein